MQLSVKGPKYFLGGDETKKYEIFCETIVIEICKGATKFGLTIGGGVGFESCKQGVGDWSCERTQGGARRKEAILWLVRVSSQAVPFTSAQTALQVKAMFEIFSLSLFRRAIELAWDLKKHLASSSLKHQRRLTDDGGW